MGESTKIQWTDKTWNPWRGCTKVSPACDDCYMFREQRRYGRDPEVVTRCGRPTFRAPLKWDAQAAAFGVRKLVFTCSWSDFFHKDADPWRDEAWDIIRRTPHLVYQILTKRPALIEKRLPPDWGDGWDNVWLGVSAEDQQYADARIPLLNNVPARVRFVSYEPALGPLDLDAVPAPPGWRPAQPGGTMDDIRGALSTYQKRDGLMLGHRVDWVIVGGESGHHARPFNLQWARSVRDQCREAGAACFVKQLGSRAVITEDIREVTQISAGHTIEGGVATLRFRDGKGGDPSEWPEDLRIREFPAQMETAP